MEVAGSRNSLHAVVHAELRDGSYATAMVIHDDWCCAAESYFRRKFRAADWPHPYSKTPAAPSSRPPSPPMAPPPPSPPPDSRKFVQ